MSELDSLKETLRETFGKIKEDMDSVRERLSQLEKENEELKQELAAQKQPTREDEIVPVIAPQKKSLIKQKVLDLMESNRYSLPMIKQIVVDKHQFCSKASFYRYVEELKSDGVAEVEVDGEKQYLRGL